MGKKWSIDIDIEDTKLLGKRLKKMPSNCVKFMDYTVKDFGRGAPGWVAGAVVGTYNIKRTLIKPRYMKKNGKDSALIYKGKRFSLIHFTNFKEPKPAYTLKAKIFKDHPKTLGKIKRLTKKQKKNITKNLNRQGTQNSEKSPIMLMSTGKKNKEKDGFNYIPFQRIGFDRKEDLRAIKTLSIPQMITNKDVAERINNKIEENMNKKMQHQWERFMSK